MTATPAQEWKQANRKEVTLPSGRTVVIRKLTAEFLLVVREVFEKYLIAGDAAAGLRLPVAEQRRYFEHLLCEGVVRPRVVPAGQEPGEHELNPADFGEDFDALLTAVSEYNEGVIFMPFRPAADGGAAAPGGEGVPGPAKQPAAGAAVGPVA